MNIDKLKEFSKEEILVWIRNNVHSFGVNVKVSELLWTRYQVASANYLKALNENKYPLSDEEITEYNSLTRGVEAFERCVEFSRRLNEYHAERSNIDALYKKTNRAFTIWEKTVKDEK